MNGADGGFQKKLLSYYFIKIINFGNQPKLKSQNYYLIKLLIF